MIINYIVLILLGLLVLTLGVMLEKMRERERMGWLFLTLHYLLWLCFPFLLMPLRRLGPSIFLGVGLGLGVASLLYAPIGLQLGFMTGRVRRKKRKKIGRLYLSLYLLLWVAYFVVTGFMVSYIRG